MPKFIYEINPRWWFFGWPELHGNIYIFLLHLKLWSKLNSDQFATLFDFLWNSKYVYKVFWYLSCIWKSTQVKQCWGQLAQMGERPVVNPLVVGWMNGWMERSNSHFEDCLQQYKIYIVYATLKTYLGMIWFVNGMNLHRSLIKPQQDSNGNLLCLPYFNV